jgi:hypothetical protein
MIVINYPEPAFAIKEEKGRTIIFDSLRKKWLNLTPEEWVRQNFIQVLIQQHNYPSTLIAIEKEIQLGELKKRFDILVYNKDHQPWLMVECKAPSVELDENVLSQLLRYNISTPVSYMLITNGDHTMGWQKKGSELEELISLPAII